MSRVTRFSADSLPVDRTDWERLRARTDDEVSAAALADPDAQPLSPDQMAAMETVPNLKRLRERLNLTQEQFARAYCLPVGTVREWEQRRRFPDAPARALLRAIEREPETLRRLLSRAA